jgi:energy-coupling factor transport system permease protein
MRHRNPTVKLLTLSALALLVSFQNNLLLNCSLSLLFLLLLLLYLPLKKLLQLLLVLTLSAVGIFFTGLMFFQESQNSPSTAAVAYALRLVSRVYCFGLLGSIFAATTTLTELIYSLQQQLRLPPVFAYGLMAAFHMAPMIPKEYRNIQFSLKSRGINYSRLSLKPLIPLLVKSIRWSELLATAMESRGFSGEAPRTFAVNLTITRKDWLFGCSLLGVGLILTILPMLS